MSRRDQLQSEITEMIADTCADDVKDAFAAALRDYALSTDEDAFDRLADRLDDIPNFGV